jgi:cellulose synthase operon protein YhjQ
LRTAEAAARKAAAERVEATRRADAAAHAAAAAEREEREIAEAHRSAQRQETAYSASEVQRRQMPGPQPGHISQPYTPRLAPETESVSEAAEPVDTVETAGREGQFAYAPDAPRSTLNLSRDAAPLRRPQGYRPDDQSAIWHSTRRADDLPPPAAPPRLDAVGDEGLGMAPAFSSGPDHLLDPEPDRVTMIRALQRAAGEEGAAENPGAKTDRRTFPDAEESEQSTPAWLYAPQTPQRSRASQTPTPAFGGDTLQDSRERVAARWFALKGVFEHAAPELPAMQQGRPDDARTPLLLMFSLAGGVGKTSLVATLGRALSSQGERVVLTDTTSHGLLPFYFGARELRPGVVRTFSAPAGTSHAPIYLVSYDIERSAGDEYEQETLIDSILRNGNSNHRIMLDLAPGAKWLIRAMVNLHPLVLVPMAPDMNSVISLQAVERFFQGIFDSDGRPLLPFYILNQFDASLPLHLDVREVFRRQLGDRLLHFVIRRSPQVSEALAEGMTVVDYAPDSPVSQDYLDVASWLKTISPPTTSAFRNIRWSEQ